MRDDLAKYLRTNSAVGKRFRGNIDGPRRRTYKLCEVTSTTLTVSYGPGCRRYGTLDKALHTQDSRVRSRKTSLPAFNPALDEVDSPFSLTR